jgi:hypothetical protein
MNDQERKIIQNFQAFVGVMFGQGPESSIPEYVATPLGIDVHIGGIMREAEALLAPHQQSALDEVCPTCGDDKIEAESWITINTGEITSNCEGECWCPTCQAHFKYTVTRKEYESDHGVRP